VIKDVFASVKVLAKI